MEIQINRATVRMCDHVKIEMIAFPVGHEESNLFQAPSFTCPSTRSIFCSLSLSALKCFFKGGKIWILLALLK